MPVISPAPIEFHAPTNSPAEKLTEMMPQIWDQPTKNNQ